MAKKKAEKEPEISVTESVKSDLNSSVTRFIHLEQEFNKVLLLADKGILRLVCATVLANQLDVDPTWLLLIAPSSGGKSEVIASLSGLEFVFPISDLTVNTFASGQVRTGKETSLLNKMKPGAIMTFKDFTSLLSKNPEARTEIMAQLREIYDKNYIKRTGTGEDIVWTGKVGAIAGSTEVVYEHLENLSAMGDRFVMYSIEQPDRLEVAERVLLNSQGMEDKRKHLKECMTNYLLFLKNNLPKEEQLVLDTDTKRDLLSVANFSTMVRSGVIMDERRGHVKFVPSKEMPMRMTTQLFNLATAFVAMHKIEGVFAHKPAETGKLTAEETNILYKIALDSIPIKRRMALKILAKYKLGVTTAGLATTIGYHTDVVKGWLFQLNGLGICRREKKGGPQGDKWYLNPQYATIMQKFENITGIEEELEDAEADAMKEEVEKKNWASADSEVATDELKISDAVAEKEFNAI